MEVSSGGIEMLSIVNLLFKIMGLILFGVALVYWVGYP